MPSIITHAVVAAAAGIAFAPRDVPGHFLPLAVGCSVIPDADVIGFSLGIQYHQFFGHRGFFHSSFFALVVSLCVVGVFFRAAGILSGRGVFYLIFFFLVSASHGILDAFTSGGLGIALLSPFDNTRYFFPWTPIMVSPIGIRAFFSEWGWMVIKSELLWVWLPCLLMVGVSRVVRVVVGRGGY